MINVNINFEIFNKLIVYYSVSLFMLVSWLLVSLVWVEFVIFYRIVSFWAFILHKNVKMILNCILNIIFIK